MYDCDPCFDVTKTENVLLVVPLNSDQLLEKALHQHPSRDQVSFTMIRSGSFGALSPAAHKESRSQSVREQRSTGGNISWSDDYGISIERKGRSLSPRAPSRGMPPKAMSARDVMTPQPSQQHQSSSFSRTADNNNPRASLMLMGRRSASERDLYAAKVDDGGRNGRAGSDTWPARGLRTEISERDLFASVKMLEDDDIDSYSDGEHSSSTTTSGSVDSFGVESVEDIHSRTTQAHRNATRAGNHDHSTQQSAAAQRSRYSKPANSYEDYDEDEDVLPDGGLSLSIMSLNSVPFAIREERLGEEHDDNNNGDQDEANTLRRSQQSSVSSPLLSTPVAYLTLMDEYDALLDRIEELEAVSERRKTEKNQLHKLVISKEEEYTERRERLERFQSRIEALEVELMTEATSSHNKYEQVMQSWRRKQKQAWEDLDIAITQLDILRSENKSHIDLLQQRPVVVHDDAALELDLQRRRKKTKQLESHLATLKEDVNRLRGRKKALLDQQDSPALIGKEIVCDEKEHASVTSLTVNS